MVTTDDEVDMITFDFEQGYGEYIDWLVDNKLVYHFDDILTDCVNLYNLPKDIALTLIVNDHLIWREDSRKIDIWTWLESNPEYLKKLGIK